MTVLGQDVVRGRVAAGTHGRAHLSHHCNRVLHRCADRRDGRAGLQLKAVARAGAHARLAQPPHRQSSSRSRRTASLAGFFDFSHTFDGPPR